MYKGERFNSITHLVGAAAALVGLVILVVTAAKQGDPWKIISFSVYGVSLFLLYLFSTLYHSLPGKGKKLFRKLDHQAIYLLIAGTYTPFLLVTLRGAWGWSLFGIIWGLAVAGIFFEATAKKHRLILPLIIYLSMGWLIMIALNPLMRILPKAGFTGLIVGGLFYTFGVIFYALDERVRHFHGIWHLFVLGGSISHYLTVLFYV